MSFVNGHGLRSSAAVVLEVWLVNHWISEYEGQIMIANIYLSHYFELQKVGPKFLCIDKIS